MADNVKVIVRVRPINSRQLRQSDQKKCLSIDPDYNSICLYSYPTNKFFSYDLISDQNSTQDEVFDKIGEPVASNCLSGYNATIFAYGQTGAGKTFTIIGPSDPQQDLTASPLRGLLPRSIEYIFESAKRAMKKDNAVEFLIKVSFLQIYNEVINDLLNPDVRNLQIREDMKKGIYVQGVQEQAVFTLEQTYQILLRGMKNRHIGQTFMNRESSRSHSVFTLYIQSKRKSEDNLWHFKTSRFHLIDLAGSQRQKLTSTGAQRLREAGMINRSLSILGSVINSLVEISQGKCRHVHYRDSKLTFLLKDSIGGNSKTSVIANVSPSVACFGETLSTLRFAQRAKQVRNRAVVNQDTMGTISELKEEIKRLKMQLEQVKFIQPIQTVQTLSGHTDETLVGFNQRILQLEEILEDNLRLRLESDQNYKEEIERGEILVKSLQETLKQYQNKSHQDKMLLGIRQETLKRIQTGRKQPEGKTIKELRQQITCLKKELTDNPLILKFSTQNDSLKSHIRALQQQIEQHPSSLKSKLKQNSEFSQKLHGSLKKSVKQRRQLLGVVSEYSKSANTQASQQAGSLKQALMELRLENKRLSDANQVLDQRNKHDTIDIDFQREAAEFSQFNEISSIMHEQNLEGQRKIRAEYQQLLQQLQFACRKNKEFQTLISNNQKKITKINRTNKRQKTKIFAHEEKIQKMTEQIEKLEQQNGSLVDTIEDLTAENQFLNTNLAKINQEIQEKQSVIQHLKKQTEGEFQNSEYITSLQSKITLLQDQILNFQNQNLQASNDLQFAMQSKDQLKRELLTTQTRYQKTQKQFKELSNELQQAIKQNQKLNREISLITGQEKSVLNTNLNQKIRLFTRMKEENNKLKQQNHKIREQARRNREKLQDLQKKYELASKAKGIRDIAEVEQYTFRNRMELMEQTLQRYRENSARIAESLFGQDQGLNRSKEFDQAVVDAVEQLRSEVEEHKQLVDEKEQEILRKDQLLKLIQNEYLVYKEKIESGGK